MSAERGPRYLHFVQSLEPLQGGGLGAAARQFHCALRRVGADSLLLTTNATKTERTQDEIFEFRRRGPTPFYFAPHLAVAARNWLEKDDRSTVVHGHGFYVYPNAVIRFLVTPRHPLVYHPHGMFEPWILARSRWKKKLVHWCFEDANFKNARLWRALTSCEADQIRKQGIKAPILVAPNGVDLKEFDLAAGPKRLGKKTVLFLGRLHPKKGLDLLLDSWARLGSTRKDWRLCLAGPEEDGFGAVVRRWIASSGLADSVEMLGPVTGETKTATFKSSDVFVLTSYSEGLPMAVLEAMACRRPVVITRACNIPEVADCEAGWMCESQVDTIVKALSAAIGASDIERCQRGERGRRLVEAKFDWEVVAQQLDGACRRLA